MCRKSNVASHTESLILRSNGARRCTTAASGLAMLVLSGMHSAILVILRDICALYQSRYTRLPLSNLISTCLVDSSITLAPDIKESRKTSDNRNLHHPPASQAHEIILLANTFHLYISHYNTSLFPPIHINFHQHTSLGCASHQRYNLDRGSPKGLTW